MLKINNITKIFNGKKVVDNVSLHVKKGEIAVLLGKSGVGKSTILRILNNLESIDSGSVEIDHKKIDVSKNQKTHIVGMVFQNFNLFEHMDALTNISFVIEKVLKLSKRKAEGQALELLQQFELLEQKHKYPSQLSGGQKQRLAIARAVALHPQVICLDEPTSALDPFLTNYVAQMITKLAHQGITVLVASHDIALLDKLEGTIYLMDQGRIVEQASTAEFKKDKKMFSRIAAFVAGE